MGAVLDVAFEYFAEQFRDQDLFARSARQFAAMPLGEQLIAAFGWFRLLVDSLD